MVFQKQEFTVQTDEVLNPLGLGVMYHQLELAFFDFCTRVDIAPAQAGACPAAVGLLLCLQVDVVKCLQFGL